MPMQRIAKQAKKAADDLIAYTEEFGTKHDEKELQCVLKAFNMLAEVVSNNGGPAWNATDGQWEY